MVVDVVVWLIFEIASFRLIPGVAVVSLVDMVVWMILMNQVV